METSESASIERLLILLRTDFLANKGNTKGKFLVGFYRIAKFLSLFRVRFPFIGFIGYPVVLSYKFIVTWLLGTEIQVNATIGKGLAVYHGQGLIVHEGAVIGNHVTLRQSTTIGSVINDQGEYLAPIIGDGVDIGCHSVLLGSIKIGANTLIGAGSIVTSDLPSNCLAAGNPAKIIKMRN